ncbi:MAG: formylglycine-generating enzyme family protein, partial [Candidatus Hydrogenedentota bacterium]
QNMGPPAKQALAMQRPPAEIEPWYGPSRGFNFLREVQPVLDRYCIGCHDGSKDGLPNLKQRSYITDYKSVFHHGGKDAGHFSVSYAELHRFVRRPGLESDYHLLTPMEFHADTTQLVQMLEKGHHGVELDNEAWDRLITWIDLNAPFHGTWHEIAGEKRVANPAKRRRELLKRYANMDQDFEAIPETPREPVETIMPTPEQQASAPEPVCPGWPFDADEARRRQNAALGELRLAADSADITPRQTIDLGNGITLELVLIPAGSFIMGSAEGYSDEAPVAAVTIERPFWMARTEITNAQFESFDPTHDSKVESRFSMQFGVRGFYVNSPGQPAVRVSWTEAMDFCAWLSEKTGRPFTLPTEAQWEYACRAGSADAFSFGPVEADYTQYANFADQKLREFVCHTYKKEREPWLHASKYDDWIPKDLRFNDGGFLSDGVALYQPNAWGLHDMHGNVWEWTRSAYRPYPYDENDGRNALDAEGDRVARGGSWRDRPMRARSAMRLPYRPYQRVYNVGFRVVSPVKGDIQIAAETKN